MSMTSATIEAVMPHCFTPALSRQMSRRLRRFTRLSSLPIVFISILSHKTYVFSSGFGRKTSYSLD